MKILLVNRTDTVGGAARGATRLLEGIRLQGADARLYVQQRTGNSPFISGPPAVLGRAVGSARRIFESILTRQSSGKTQGLFSPALLPDNLSSRISAFAPDIIHIHWVARMMRLETLSSFKVPTIWTLHDSWPFTGGCFLPGECKRYREKCGKCPVLVSSQEEDLSRRVWQRKWKAWQDLNLTFIAPSRWMGECARSSSLFRDMRVEIIPNGLDITQFQPSDKLKARAHLSLPQDKKFLLFGAKSATQDRNKGFHLLVQSLHEIVRNNWGDKIELIVFGSSQPDMEHGLNLKTHFMGWQQDDSTLALIYAAADVFVFPSLQESLGYTAMEAMACGTPCVAFRQGGVPDLIDHEQNGYLAVPFEPADLARGIVWVLEEDARWHEMAARSRRKVEQEFAIEKVAGKHMALYKELQEKSCS